MKPGIVRIDGRFRDHELGGDLLPIFKEMRKVRVANTNEKYTYLL